MKKFVCMVCGYVYEGETAPKECPQCHAPASKFQEQNEDMSWAAEHSVGVAKGVSEDILMDLRANFTGECTEVGFYTHFEVLFGGIGHHFAEKLSKFGSMFGFFISRFFPI